MALVPYLYVGHFIPEEGYVRFADHLPVVTRPINMSTVARLLRDHLQDVDNPTEVPADWAMSFLPDYIVCNLLGASPEALQFAAEYAKQEGATILDMGAFTVLSSEQLQQRVEALHRAQLA